MWNDPQISFLRAMKPLIPHLILGLYCVCLLPACMAQPAHSQNPYPSIGAIPLPSGYTRLPAGPNTFSTWLRHVSLKKDRTVYLYNGSPKRNQHAQFAVLDVSVGHEDLQQCADAVMRLRAEFLYANNKFSSIAFYTDQGTCLGFQQWANGIRYRLSGSRLVPVQASRPSTHRADFDAYLVTVFEYCGTHSLEKQLQKPKSIASVEPGDVLIKGGSPGHAMLVVDAAEDKQGHRIYLLAQSYMPAQDIHIVVNPVDPALSPWYRADQAQTLLETPEWTFTINQLRAWSNAN
jgi:Domain of unknown function (4846)